MTLLITVPLLVGRCVYYDVTRQLVAHNLGLCTGLTEDTGDEALTPWLHNLIQEAAGRKVNDAPLTFGDLWSAPAPPENQQGWESIWSIDLQMFSTNLSHGRPYIFPLTNQADFESTDYGDQTSLYFKEDDMRRCLPADVVHWMVDHSPSLDRNNRHHENKELLESPKSEDFPILLAARMSLSFPFLFTAVPLYATATDASGEKTFRRCWFSDGGISSNFPMHLFEGLIPLWPTFGFNLEPKIEGRDLVFLPQTYSQGCEERWNHIPDQRGTSTVGGFIGAIVSTMQNWNDNSVARLPGVRDKVVRVSLEKHEGGMNLNMKDEHIKNIADRGVLAAQELLARFSTPPRNGRLITGWDEHRFVRLNILYKTLQQSLSVLILTLSPYRHVTDFSTLMQNMMNLKDDVGNLLPPPGYTEPMTDTERRLLERFITNLQTFATDMTTLEKLIRFKPTPFPILRVRPPL